MHCALNGTLAQTWRPLNGHQWRNQAALNLLSLQGQGCAGVLNQGEAIAPSILPARIHDQSCFLEIDVP